MNTYEMDSAFEQYLESNEYDEAEGLLLAMLRKAFRAGWDAAKAEQAET